MISHDCFYVFLFQEVIKLKTALSIIFIIVCVALTIVVLMQEGKNQGLSGSISGAGGDTYWSKNKGRSKDAVMVKITTVLGVVFIVLAILLSSKWI